MSIINLISTVVYAFTYPNHFNVTSYDFKNADIWIDFFLQSQISKQNNSCCIIDVYCIFLSYYLTPPFSTGTKCI